MILTKDRAFYKEFFSLYWLLVLQNVIIVAVNLVSNIMLGNYSSQATSGAAMAGVSTVGQIQFLVQNVIMGLGEALVVISSQYWGQRRTGPIVKFTGIAMLGAVGFSLLMFAAVSISLEGSVALFTDNQEYIREGAKYLRIIRYSYPVFAVTTILLAMLRSVHTVRIAFWVSISTLVVNIAANYALIFGRLGFPEMGVYGSAIGTLAARIIEMLIVLIYVFKLDEKLHIRVSSFRGIDRLLLGDFAKVAVPITLVALVWGANTALQTLILGRMPGDAESTAIAANAIASNLMLVLKAASVGAAAAAMAVIGKAVGSGNLGKVREYTRTLQLIFSVIAVLTGVGLFLLRYLVPFIYKDLAPSTLAMTDSFLLVLCVTSTGMGYQMPTAAGIIRGGGDARFCMITDLTSIYAVVLPLSFLAAFVFHWPPVAVVICLNCDQVFKALPIAIKVNRYTWIRHLTRQEAT